MVFGKAHGFGARIDLAAVAAGTGGFVLRGIDNYDLAGISVSSAGDINGDGIDDLVIGARHADGEFNTAGYAGEAYVVFGRTTGFGASVDLSAIAAGTGGFGIFNEDAYDFAGGSVASAGDINGDGFDDLIIGNSNGAGAGNATYGAGEAYVLLGRDFTGSVTHAGTIAANTLTGTIGADVMVGGQGADTLIGRGGADTLIGGSGDDTIRVSDRSFRRVDGGGGTDTLALDGGDTYLTLYAISDLRIQGIERIDLTGTGDNGLTLTYREVLNLSGTSNTLRVDGNAGDSVFMMWEPWVLGATVGGYGSAEGFGAGIDMAAKGSALITGAKGLGSLKGDGANNKTSANRVAGVTASAGTSINARTPGSATIVGLQGRVPAAPGTTAIIRAGADIVAGGSIGVTGWANTRVAERLGGVAVGGLGLGASVAIFSIADNVTASNDGTSSAGGVITVDAFQFSTVDITSLGMQAGFVGLGAAVVVIDDSSVTTASLGNVTRASFVDVTALSDRRITEVTGQISVGAVGAGATFTRLNVGGGVSAGINAGAVIGGADPVRLLNVQATARVAASVTTVAVSAGIGAFNANFADLNIAPTVSATIGAKANVSASQGVSLIADTVFENKALTKGVAAGGLAVGVSLTEITVAPVLRAEVGAQAMVRTNTLTVTAGGPGRTAGDAGYDALAQATGSAGALVGITSTNSRVVNNAQLDALIGDGATITVARSVTVSALNNMRQKADADSKAGGLVAAGAAKSEVVSTGTSQARIGAGVMLTAQALTVEALGIEDNFARTNAGSGGAIAGASATARTTNTSTTLASIGKGSIVTLYGDPGALSVVADHTALFNAQVTSLAGGVLAGAGGEVTNLVAANVTAAIGDNAIITARSIEMLSVNRVEKPVLAGGVTENLKGTTGGLASAAGATDTTTVHVTTKIRFGNGAQMTILGNNANEHSFSLSARNEYNVRDKIAFVTGGAVSGAMAFAGISVPTAVAAVEIGANAVLTTTDAIDISARGNGELSQDVFAETYGAGTATVGSASVDIRPDNRVFIGANAKITALGDINLSAGSETNFTEDAYHLRSRFDGFAGSLIPLSDVGASTSLVQANAITIASGAHLLTARAANLFTGRFGTNDLDAKAKVTSWISEATSAVNQAGGGGSLQDFANSTVISTARGVIQMDGKVETGLNRNLSLTLKDWNGATGQITDFTATKGIGDPEPAGQRDATDQGCRL